MPRLLTPLILIAALVALALPGSAAASADGVIRDCSRDGKLDQSYTRAELRGALSNLPADLREYSDCSEIIAAAVGNAAGGTGPKANSAVQRAGKSVDGAELSARAADQKNLDKLAAEARKPGAIDVGGDQVTPGSDGLFTTAKASDDMPLPLLLAIIGLGLLALAGGFMALRSRVPALARISLRQRGPFSRDRR